jgi:hypothetical protein
MPAAWCCAAVGIGSRRDKEEVVMTTAEFRKKVKSVFPHVTVSIRTVSFSDLARCSRKCLTISGDRPGELRQINDWAREAEIIPDGNIRCY